MIVDRHGRAHYPAGTPRSKGGEFAPTGAAGWVKRLSARTAPGDITPGRSTPMRRREEVRLPLGELRLLYGYGDENRLAIPDPPTAGGPAPGPTGPNWPADLAAQLRAAYPGLMLDLHRDPSGYVILPRISVPARGQGTGTAIMQRIIDAADANGDTLALSPSTAFGGTSEARLIRFYRRFGFVPNKGRAKDFTTRETMIRRPRS